MGARPGRRGRPRSAQRDPLHPGGLPRRPVRHPDDRRRGVRRRTVRRRAVRSLRPLCARHPVRRRDHRPAGHRHQAVQAPRRVQPHQDLPGDRRRPEDRAGRRSPGRAGVDLREPPPARPGRRVPQAEPRDLRGQGRRQDRAASTRSSAPGASSRPCATQPAGRGAAVDFRFRNGRRVHFEAHEILYRQAPEGRQGLHLVPARSSSTGSGSTSTTSAPAWSRRTSSSTWAVPSRNWDLDLDPLPGHFDRRITVTTPLQKAGAYLLTARMEGGNTSRIVVWLDDTVIVKKPLAEKAYYFIADARTGQPVPRADVELFGWRMVQVDGRNEFRVETKTLVAQGRRRRPAPGPDRRAERPRRDSTSGSSPPARPRAAWPTRASRTSGASAGTTRPMTR